MTETQETYEKGDLVPGPGTYRCSCGELWSTSEKNVRFPPCEACKHGGARWIQISAR
jgi:hypothetical protein